MNAVKRTEVPRFRSQWNYGPDCPSLTVYGRSEVDSSQYEEVGQLVLKLLRGEVKPAGEAVFDADSAADPEKVIREMPVVRTPGFDLSDASEALKEGKEALRTHAQAVKDKEAQEKKAAEEKKAVKEKAEADKAAAAAAAKAAAPEGAK